MIPCDLCGRSAAYYVKSYSKTVYNYCRLCRQRYPKTASMDFIFKPITLKYRFDAWREKLKFWKRHDLHWADGTVFMTRWTLYKGENFSIKIHCFRKSDEEIHDHPWDFWSIVLWGSYVEESAKEGKAYHNRCPDINLLDTYETERPWLSMGWHDARYNHRVRVKEGKQAWTLCVTSDTKRDWGFFTPTGWVKHDSLIRDQGRGKRTT